VNSRVFGVRELKYAMRIFNGAKGVAVTAKFSIKICQNCTYYSSVQDMETFFMYDFSGLASSNMLSEFFIEQMALPWQPNVGKKINHKCNKLGHNFGPMQTTFVICVHRICFGSLNSFMQNTLAMTTKF